MVGYAAADWACFFQCSSCSQQFMQKKDLQSHMIKLHGAPKPHAVSARQGWSTCDSCAVNPVLTWHCSIFLSNPPAVPHLCQVLPV